MLFVTTTVQVVEIDGDKNEVRVWKPQLLQSKVKSWRSVIELSFVGVEPVK